MSDKDTLSTSENQGEIVIYQTNDGDTKTDVRFVDATVWLTQQTAELFQSSRTNIQHINEEGEPDEDSTYRKFRQVQTESSRQVVRELPYYNIDYNLSWMQSQIYRCNEFSFLGRRANQKIYD